MDAPPHDGPIGTALPPDYFSPGTSIMHGKLCFSTWAIAYWAGQQFRYERADYGADWVRVA